MLNPGIVNTSFSFIKPMCRVIPFFCRTPPTEFEECSVKTYPSDVLFHKNPTDLPMEEHIRTRDPSDFQELNSNLQDIFSTPLDFYFHTSPDTLITSRTFCLIFKAPFGFSLPYPFFTHLHAPRISSSVWGVRIKNRMTRTCMHY